MPRKKSENKIEELKEKRPRKTRKEALIEKIAAQEERLAQLKEREATVEESIARLKEKLENIGSNESKKARSVEQKQMINLLQEKGLTLAQLEELLNKE